VCAGSGRRWRRDFFPGIAASGGVASHRTCRSALRLFLRPQTDRRGDSHLAAERPPGQHHWCHAACLAAASARYRTGAYNADYALPVAGGVRSCRGRTERPVLARSILGCPFLHRHRIACRACGRVQPGIASAGSRGADSGTRSRAGTEMRQGFPATGFAAEPAARWLVAVRE
jgi:hypothetical protein